MRPTGRPTHSRPRPGESCDQGPLRPRGEGLFQVGARTSTWTDGASIPAPYPYPERGGAWAVLDATARCPDPARRIAPPPDFGDAVSFRRRARWRPAVASFATGREPFIDQRQEDDPEHDQPQPILRVASTALLLKVGRSIGRDRPFLRALAGAPNLERRQHRGGAFVPESGRTAPDRAFARSRDGPGSRAPVPRFGRRRIEGCPGADRRAVAGSSVPHSTRGRRSPDVLAQLRRPRRDRSR